jgi:hypothetical protein
MNDVSNLIEKKNWYKIANDYLAETLANELSFQTGMLHYPKNVQLITENTNKILTHLRSLNLGALTRSNMNLFVGNGTKYSLI